QAIRRMVEGYDAADPDRASTFALRDEWMGHGLGRQGRIAGGYGALIRFLVSECRRQGVSIHLGCAVTGTTRAVAGLPVVVTTAPPSRQMPRFLPCRPPSCPTSRFLRPYARRPRLVPISDLVMSSKFCCDSQRNGGPIVGDAISPT